MRIEDPHWPTAADWLRTSSASPRLVVAGVPCSAGSLSPSDAWATPPALRASLDRFASFDGESGTDLRTLPVHDAGDLDVADLALEEALPRIQELAGDLPAAPVRGYLGGDNAITRPLARLAAADAPGRLGLLTLDAHHDVRVLDDGPTNGTPVRGLIEEDGVAGRHVVQIGIHSFANSAAYRGWCEDHGITVRTMAEITRRGVEEVVHEALDHLAQDCDRVYVDVDVDVLDRAFAPACPGARPGGMTPRQLAAAARVCGAHPMVAAADFVEVDARADAADQRTVMAMASAFLAFCAGVAGRRGGDDDA